MTALLSLATAILWLLTILGLIRPELLGWLGKRAWTRKRVAITLIPIIVLTNLINGVATVGLNGLGESDEPGKGASIVSFDNLSDKRKDLVIAFVAAIDDGNEKRIAEMLRVFPQLPNCTYAGDTRNPWIRAAVGSSSEAQTTFYQAVRGGNPSVVKLLLDHGANPDGNPSSGETPLTVAAYRFNFKLPVLQLLLQYGADPNIPDDQGGTALHECANAAGIRALLTAGADPTIRNKNFDLPVDVATGEAKEVLEQAMAVHNAQD